MISFVEKITHLARPALVPEKTED